MRVSRFASSITFTLAVAGLLVGAACGGSQPAPAGQTAATRGLKIAMIAKSSTNPVFLSARTGAEAAAKELTAEARRAGRDRVADAAERGRTGPGAADRAGGQRRRDRRFSSRAPTPAR